MQVSIGTSLDSDDGDNTVEDTAVGDEAKLSKNICRSTAGMNKLEY